LINSGQLLDDENSGAPIVWTDNFSNLFQVLRTWDGRRVAVDEAL
jgi:hypothetical protein